MIFHYVLGGALMCEIELPGITQCMLKFQESEFPLESLSWYDGHRYFVAESMTKE